MTYGDTKLLSLSPFYWDSVVKEAIEIHCWANLVNRDMGFPVRRAWDPALTMLNSRRSSTVTIPNNISVVD